MIPKFKAAMFDMDGTLLHTMRYWRLTTIEVLLGRDIFPNPEQMARVWNTSSRALCKEILLENGIELSDQEILHEMESYMLPHYQKDAKKKARVGEYLEKLHRQGIPMCIATAAPKEFAREALERLGLAQYFLFITDCYEQKMSKREPEFFRIMAEKLGVETKDMCVFEDAPYSMRGAKAAGCPVIAIQDYMYSEAEAREIADLYITGYEELL